jgi:membrane-anchored mycosin MYCP
MTGKLAPTLLAPALLAPVLSAPARSARVPLAPALLAPALLVLAGLLPAQPPGPNGHGGADAGPVAAGPVAAWAPEDPRQQCALPATQVVHETPWTLQRLAPQRVWPLTRGAGVVVAVIDSGVDGSVPQLRGRVLPGLDVLHGGGAPADTDCYGHGTFVAGIIAAAQVPGIGFAGIAPDATILPIRQSSGPQDGTAGGIAAGIRAAVDGGARVINMSVSSTAPTHALQAAVEYAERHDVVLVAAAANEAARGNPRTYPAAYPGVIAVGSVGPEDKRSDFSETGDFVDVAAPGTNVQSLGTGGPGHLVGEGTSYAAPFVSGVAALIRAYYPRMPAAEVKRRIELTADHPPGALPDPGVGWGVVNPYAAVASTMLAGDRARAAAPAAADPPAQPAAGRSARRLLALAGLALALVAVALLSGAAVRGGVRRGWRAGTYVHQQRQ